MITAKQTKSGWYKVTCNKCKATVKKMSIGREWQCGVCGTKYTMFEIDNPQQSGGRWVKEGDA